MKQQKTVVLVNPRAGRGSAVKRKVEFERLALEKGIEYEIYQTEYSGHAQILAGRALEEGADLLVVIGGDGTVSDVADVLAGSPVTIGIIPGGTGNDIARSLGIETNNTPEAFRKIVNGDTILFDVGLDSVSRRRFVSFVGCGFPALVAAKANSMKYMKGRIVFFISLYAVVRKMKGMTVGLAIDGATEELFCTSIMIQNTPYTGGGLKVAPGASINDGLLDVVVVGEIGILELMKNFPRLYTGGHLSHPAFRVLRGRKISVELPERQLVSYDGETDFADRLEIEVKPGAMKLRV